MMFVRFVAFKIANGDGFFSAYQTDPRPPYQLFVIADRECVAPPISLIIQNDKRSNYYVAICLEL
jgi:hypothetical protein